LNSSRAVSTALLERDGSAVDRSLCVVPGETELACDIFAVSVV